MICGFYDHIKEFLPQKGGLPTIQLDNICLCNKTEQQFLVGRSLTGSCVTDVISTILWNNKAHIRGRPNCILYRGWMSDNSNSTKI